MSYYKEKNCRLCKKVYTTKAPRSFYCLECKIIKRKEWVSKYDKSERAKVLRRKRDKTEKAKDRYVRYRNKPKYKEYSRKRWLLMPTNIKKARTKVRNSIRDGKLIKPNYCEKCKIKDWGKKRSMIEAHHYKGYSPENWLVIRWLCTNCHKEVVHK